MAEGEPRSLVKLPPCVPLSLRRPLPAELESAWLLRLRRRRSCGAVRRSVR